MTGWMVGSACVGLGAVIGLYLRFRSQARRADEAAWRNRLVFAAVALVAVGGGATAAYGYKGRAAGEVRLSEAEGVAKDLEREVERMQKTPADSLAKLLEPSPEEIELRRREAAALHQGAEADIKKAETTMYAGIGVLATAVLAGVLFAGYLIRTGVHGWGG